MTESEKYTEAETTKRMEDAIRSQAQEIGLNPQIRAPEKCRDDRQDRVETLCVLFLILGLLPGF